MRGTYTLTRKDLLEAQTRHAGVFFRVSQALGAFMLTMGLATIATSQYTLSVVPILIGSFLLFRLRFSVRNSYKRDFATLGQMEAVVTDSGIEFLSIKGTTDFNWSAFVRYVQTEHLFVIYSQSNIFNMIPKRGFAPGELESVRHLFALHLGAKSAAHNKKPDPRLIALAVGVAIVVGLLLVVIFRR